MNSDEKEDLSNDVDAIINKYQKNFPCVVSVLYVLKASIIINDEIDFAKWCSFYAEKQMESLAKKRR